MTLCLFYAHFLLECAFLPRESRELMPHSYSPPKIILNLIILIALADRRWRNCKGVCMLQRRHVCALRWWVELVEKLVQIIANWPCAV